MTVSDSSPCLTGQPPAGILNVNKPAGLTSHDVVARVRRWTGQRKVGHAGTLDPLATGVLLVCLGAATRLAEYLMSGRKVYRVVVQLGVETDTYDADGTVLRADPLPDLTLDQIGRALVSFEGIIQQVPPPYSALRHHGTRLYRLARQGTPLRAAPRPVEIEAIRLLAWESPRLTLEVACSPGTYIRSLAHDLGHVLGTGAHVSELTRLASGSWRIEEAVTLEQLRAALEAGDWVQLVQPMHAAVDSLERIDLSEELARRVALGQPVPLSLASQGSLVRAHAPGGGLLALLRPADQPGWWHPVKVLGC
jgi:tRNA pseudouridine55 synthase